MNASIARSIHPEFISALMVLAPWAQDVGEVA